MVTLARTMPFSIPARSASRGNAGWSLLTTLTTATASCLGGAGLAVGAALATTLLAGTEVVGGGVGADWGAGCTGACAAATFDC